MNTWAVIAICITVLISLSIAGITVALVAYIKQIGKRELTDRELGILAKHFEKQDLTRSDLSTILDLMKEKGLMEIV